MSLTPALISAALSGPLADRPAAPASENVSLKRPVSSALDSSGSYLRHVSGEAERHVVRTSESLV